MTTEVQEQKKEVEKSAQENLYCKTCGKRLDVCPYHGRHPLKG